MLKKIKQSIETMPRCAYIFLKNVLFLSCVMLFAAAMLFISSDGTIADYEKIKYATLFLETPAGILLLGVIGTAILIDIG